MPAQKAPSALAGLETQLKQAHNEVINEETKYDTGGEPPLVAKGVAQLLECKFDRHKDGDHKGKPYFYMAASIVEPKEHEGIRLNYPPIPLYPTPNRKNEKTVKDHLSRVYNHLRLLLGVEKLEMPFEALEPTAADLKEQAPFFAFRTWKGKKQEIENRSGKFWVGKNGPYPTEDAAKKANPYVGQEPSVNQVWDKKIDYNGQVADEVIDNSDTADADVVATGGDNEELLVRNLADAADSDPESQARLAAIAEELGIDHESIPSWGELADAILEARAVGVESESEPEPEPEVPAVPDKGDVFKYKPDPKKKHVQVEVLLVNAKAKTVTLKNLTDGKTQYKGVPFDKLEMP